MKLTLIILSSIIGLFLMGFLMVMSSQNGAISLEETVKTSLSDIDVHLTKRFNKLNELAECVKQYDSHEYKTLVDVISARGKNMSGKDVKQCLASFSRLEERYPELKSQSNYKMLMTEVSLEENHLGQSRKAYNEFVRDYNRYCRKFPTALFLSMTGYERVQFARYETDEAMRDTKPLKLF